MQTRLSGEDKILWMLRQGPRTGTEIMLSKWSDNKSLMRSYHQRIGDLRSKGYDISYSEETDTYRLISEPVRIKTEDDGQLSFAV